MDCLVCGKALRNCRNCRFYLSGSAGNYGELPADKERIAFCIWFSINPRFCSQTRGQKKAQEEAFEALCNG